MKRRPAKKQIAPKVQRVKLKPDVVLVVEAPKGIAPAIAPHPERNAVEIVAVPAGKPWWKKLMFG